MCVKYYELRYMFYKKKIKICTSSQLVRLLDTVSKFALFSVFGLKDKTSIKKQTYTKTETCKLYSRVFWIFLPNVIKIDPYIIILSYTVTKFARFLRRSVFDLRRLHNCRYWLSDTYCEVDQSKQPRSHVSCQLLVSASNIALGRFPATELPTDRHMTIRHQKEAHCRISP